LTKTLRELAFSEIRDLIHRRVSVFRPGDPVSRVLGELRETGRREAVAAAADERVGLVTVRDLLRVSQPAQTKVGDVWRVTGSASPSDRVIDLAETMIRNSVRAMPVVDDGGDVVGVASQVDLTEAMCDVQELAGIKAKGLMRRPVVSLDVDEKVALARRLMLERGFSHIPIVENGVLVGMVTAEGIVHAFVTPTAKTTTGDRVGERVARLPGPVRGIMDLHPFTVGPDASALDTARGLRDRGKSACIITDPRREVLGILTPRELMAPLLSFRPAEELPVYILGLSDEDFFERAVAEGKVRRVVQRSMRMHPHITEVSVRIKRQQKGGERTRYQMTARAMGAEGQFIAEEEGWDLLQVFDELCDTLGKALRRSKHVPERTRSRRRSRFRR